MYAASANSRSRLFNFGAVMETKGKPKRGVRSQEPRARTKQEESGDSGGPKNCEECSRWKAIRKKVRVAELLGTAIQKLKERFEEQDFKPSVADYLKLVELEEQLEQGSDTVKEIKVTWVEPTESETAE